MIHWYYIVGAAIVSFLIGWGLISVAFEIDIL